MLLDYYSVSSCRTAEDTTVFEIALNPDSAVYRGHFPGMPVAPGVCNIQMIKECAEQLTGHALQLDYVAQCRMTTLLTPQQYPDLQVRIRLCENDGVRLKAQTSIGQGEATYFTLTFEARIQNSL
jgi:3-hydroxyacyl-[acyl-carrier-protein] dehydratase